MLDLSLAFYLVVVLPAQALWVSFHQKKDVRTRMQRYLTTIGTILSALAVLALSMWVHQRDAASLGLAIPMPEAGVWGLAAAGAILAAVHLAGARSRNKMSDQERAAYVERLNASDGIPKTRTEMAIFLLMILFIGVGWELLYRGFLLLVLTPMIGIGGAVALVSVSYALGHGFRGIKPFAGSLAAALAFTIAFVYTKSLWWLIVVHIGLPLHLGLSAWLAARSLPGRTGVVPAP